MTCLLFQICFYFMYGCMFVRVNAMCVQVPMKSRGAGDPGGCELPNVNSGLLEKQEASLSLQPPSVYLNPSFLHAREYLQVASDNHLESSHSVLSLLFKSLKTYLIESRALLLDRGTESPLQCSPGLFLGVHSCQPSCSNVPL